MIKDKKVIETLDTTLEEAELKNMVGNSLIGFVGFAYIIMGIWDVIYDFNKVFIIGATISGFFFVVGDIYSSSMNLTNKLNIYIFYSTTILAIASFIVLPALLMESEGLLEWFNKFSDSVTITSLGAVLTLININNWNEKFKNDKDKVKLVREYRSEIEILRQKVEQLEVLSNSELPVENAATIFSEKSSEEKKE